MRPFLAAVILFASLALATAADSPARVIKVLPLLLDLKGHSALSPSLFDRDAYQARLRQLTNEVSGIQFNIQWAAPESTNTQYKLQAELRGIGADSLPRVKTLEATVKPKHYRNWTVLLLNQADYKKFGDLAAWRVTLWQGDQQISEQKSFLW